MSDMHEINPGNVGSERHTVVLRNVSHSNLSILKINKMLLYIIAALMLVVVLMGVLLFPTNHLLNDYQQNQASVNVNNVNMNPVVSAEIKMLKSQLIGLISGSIESKLRLIEESMHPGSISITGMGALQDIKNDIKVLKTYSESGAGRLIVEKYAKQNAAATIDKQLMQEVSQLKNLIYLSIASCGLMLAAVGGIWFRTQYRLSHDDGHKEARSPSPAREKKAD
jgi:hypothetical protein